MSIRIGLSTKGTSGTDPALDSKREPTGVERAPTVQPRADSRLETIKAGGNAARTTSSFGYAAGTRQADEMPGAGKAPDAVAPRTPSFAKDEQDPSLKEVMLAFRALPPQLQARELRRTLEGVRAEMTRQRMETLASHIASLEDLRDVADRLQLPQLGQPDFDANRAMDEKRSYFLAAVVERIKMFPPEHRAEAHELISNAITMLPPDLRAHPAEKLAAAEAGELLTTEVLGAYEQSGRIEQAAASVQSLADVLVLLAESGIQGPRVADDAIGLIVQSDGNLGLSALPRPEPLAAIANRIGNFQPVVAGESNAAFHAVLDATNAVHPERRRIPALIALASAAGRLGDGERQAAYESVLRAGHELWSAKLITTEQYAKLLNTLHVTVSGAQGAPERAASEQLRRAIDQMGVPGFQSLLSAV